jgi:hypothetical protein
VSVGQVARQTQANTNSMLQDVRAGRPTETDAIYGHVIRRAAVHAVPVPMVRLLEALVAVVEAGAAQAPAAVLGAAAACLPIPPALAQAWVRALVAHAPLPLLPADPAPVLVAARALASVHTRLYPTP